MPRAQPVSIEAIIDRLKEESRLIQNRGALTSQQELRVDDAFALLAAGEPSPESSGKAKRLKYLNVLKRVEEQTGWHMSSYAPRLSMKERQRVLGRPILEKIASMYKTKKTSGVSSLGLEAPSTPVGVSLPGHHGLAPTTTSQFTGDAYELTWDDARTIATSGQDVVHHNQMPSVFHPYGANVLIAFLLENPDGALIFWHIDNNNKRSLRWFYLCLVRWSGPLNRTVAALHLRSVSIMSSTTRRIWGALPHPLTVATAPLPTSVRTSSS
ncbi:hypothetical protein RJ55_07257 [Drechmeria coniospora]|nr:hypothetical protein RJ55_07257 [Drechmeria coniospora]